jgi:hypothetical protein
MKTKLTERQAAIVAALPAALPWSYLNSARIGWKKGLWSYWASGGVLIVVPLGINPQALAFGAPRRPAVITPI